MKISIKSPHRATAALLAALAFTASLSAQNVTLFTEAFGGLGSAGLNGTTAENFNSAITTAGGSNLWVAGGNIRANGGSIATGDQSGYLNLGTYINDSKGTDNGKFILQATFSTPSGTNTSFSVGFTSANLSGSPLLGNFSSTFSGVATSIMRSSDISLTNHFARLNQTTGVSGASAFDPGDLTGSVTFTTTLDFTPAGGYNGTNNFGTVTFQNSVNSVVSTYTYGAGENYAFNGVGHTKFAGSASTISNYSLVQVISAVPEPSTYAMLVGMGMLGFAATRRRRSV